MDQERYGDSAKSTPESIQKIEGISALISELQNKLTPVLRPDNELKNAAGVPEQSKSDLMYGFVELENKLNNILNRLHI